MKTLGLELNHDMLIYPLRPVQLLLSLVLIICLCCLPPCLAPLQAADDLLCARDQIAWTCTAPCTKNSPATSTKNSCARTTQGDQTKIQHRRNKIESNQQPREQEEEKASFPIDRGGEGLLSHRFAVPGLKDP
jgi:hypothetical protein